MRSSESGEVICLPPPRRRYTHEQDEGLSPIAGAASIPSLPGFRILARLGEGGMGVVYRALDERLGREVALKFVSARSGVDRELRERLLREAQAASSLDHPNVGTIYGVAETPAGELCIIMALYEGETLSARLARGPLPAMEVVRLGAEIASGLAAAHARGIVHRDVKPSNIILTESGTAKLVDFGLARLEREAVEQPLTAPQALMGTAAYMSPEQASGGKIDARTDIFSLGSVLYEALSGRRAFPGRDVLAQLDGVVRRDPQALDSGNPELDSIILSALNKNVERRFQNAAAVAAALEPLLVPHRTTARSTALRSSRARMVVAAAMALAVAAAVYFRQDLQRWTLGPTVSTIAFLPFEGSDDPPTAALATGLSEALAQRMADVQSLNAQITVVPTADLMARNVTTPQDARKFAGATIAVAGTLKRHKSAEVTVELKIHDSIRNQVITEVFKAPQNEMRMLENRAAAFLSSYLEVRTAALGPQLLSGSAYESYLRGLGFLSRWDKPGNLDRAVVELSAVVQAAPKSSPGLAALAEASRTRFRVDRDPADLQHALTYARQAVDADSNSVDAHITLGRVYQDSGQRDLAVLEFKRALDTDPRRWAAFAGLARSYEDAGRLAESEASLQQAAELNSYSWAPYNALGSYYLRHSRYRDAEIAYRRGLQLTPDNQLLHSNLGVVFMRLRDWQKATEELKTSLAIAPSYSAQVNLGNVHYAAGDFKAAAAAYEAALRLNGRDFRTWGNWAQALRLSGAQREQTMSAYRKATQLAEDTARLSPGDARSRSLLAIYLACLGEPHRARLALEDALSKPAPAPDVLVDAAIAYALSGDRESAVEWARRSLEAGYNA
ncbi:MAG TPA: protein kinase, partial [Bryobacteraceae bacterium]|nr:protein kinase [Bryobacteraceae bacterium]